MDAQTLMDLVALTTTDKAMLDMFEVNKNSFEDGCGAEHQVLMHLIVKAIDNVYGDGSFDIYKNSGLLPSEQ